MCLRCYRGLFRYTHGNAELFVPAHVFGLRFVRCHSLHVCMQQLVLYRCEVSEGPWAIVGMPFLMIMKMWIWCRTMMMLMRAVLMMMMLLRMLLVIAVDGIYDQNCHVNSHHSGHSICRGHCAGICTWPTVAAWRYDWWLGPGSISSNITCSPNGTLI